MNHRSKIYGQIFKQLHEMGWNPDVSSHAAGDAEYMLRKYGQTLNSFLIWNGGSAQTRNLPML